MTSLNELYEKTLKLASAKNIKLLHNLIFEHLGDRQNRSRLRKFAGFEFADLDENEGKNKLDFILATFSDNDLIIICNLLQLECSGTKNEIAHTILMNLNDLNVLRSNMIIDDDDDAGISDEDIFDNTSETSNVENPNLPKPDSPTTQFVSDWQTSSFPKLTLSFRDIESTIRPFNGSSFCSVVKWVSEFEDISELLGWCDLQKLIFARRSLTGKAKLWMQGELGIKSWDKFKSLLISEFGEECNSAEIHSMLDNRYMRKNESVEEYFLIMKELASRGNIENSALIHYVIHGIQDSVNNKSILYGTKDLQEFKKKLKAYENLKLDGKKSKIPKYESKSYNKQKQTSDKNFGSNFKCFNCGSGGHKSTFCPDKNKGLKCFKCNTFGHKSSLCPKNNNPRTKQDKSDVSIIKSKPSVLTNKVVTISKVDINALCDTGSEATLINHDIYLKIGSPTLNCFDIVLTGFGNSKIKPLGCFESKIGIDGYEFSSNIGVVENKFMPYEAIIGTDVLRQGDVIINKDGISIKKCFEETKLNEEVHVCNIMTDKDFELNIGTSVSKKQKQIVEQLVYNYKPNKIKTTNIEMNIQVSDEIPIVHRPRRLPFVEREIVDKQIQEWIAEGIIEPSSSDYSSQVVVVKKKDGTPRICLDYRKLNKKIIKDRYPLPLIDDVLDKLQNAHMFSSIDLKNGFFHVGVDKASQKYTSFVTHNGQFNFLRTPFGLCKSPAVFQRFINSVFKDLILQGYLFIYMDDLIIPSKDAEEGIERLKLVFDVARDYGLEINIKKCQFLSKKIEFLGHIIENGTLSPSPLKTAAVINYPEPKNLKEIQSFLGLTGYFRKFIQNYSTIAKPLSDLLKKQNSFKFEKEEKIAFNKLKQILSEKPVIAIYNQHSETELHTDASIDGYGCVLMQKSTDDNCFHPTYFMSKKTTDAEKKYCSYELEVLAIVQALKKFRVYLLGKPFKLVTDCNAFKMTMNKRDLSTRIARWALLLEDFDYTIEHRSGNKMSHVDALSRSPVMVIVQDTVTMKIKCAQETDDEIQAIKEVLKSKPYNDYCMQGEILYKLVNGSNLLVVPEAMQAEIIKGAHDRGHFSIKRTEEVINQEFYIPKVKQKIEQCILNCVPCILVNRKCGKQEGQLHPLHKEEIPLCTYHIDHLGPLPSTNKQYNYIFAVIDSFTKFVWLYPTKSTSTDEVITKLNNQKAIFGNPNQLISDKGTAFTSKEFEEYCAKENIKHFRITTGLPRANGQIERLNSIIVSVLSKLSVDNPSRWFKYVTDVQQIINSTFQRSIGMTPFELLFGAKMRSASDIKITELLNNELRSEFILARDELRKDAKLQILKVQEENSKTFNRKRKTAHKYKINELVAIKRTQYGAGLKLKAKFLGPYKVINIKPNDTYDVQKVGPTEGPFKTSTCAEFMKQWPAGSPANSKT